MVKNQKSLRRIGAWALAAAMLLGTALPAAPLTAEAAETVPVNLALASNGASATANDTETNDYQASKAIDGIVNRDAPKPQSRWATNTSSAQAAKILTVNLGEEKTFQSFVIAWERLNITSYKIETSSTGGNEEAAWTTVYEKQGDDPISDLNENIHLAAPVSAQYVRLYVDGYALNPGNWQSVSVYEFQVYENEIPDDLLPEENYCLEGTAQASDYEPTAGDTQAADKAIDGDKTTRWATNNAGNGTTARTLTVTLPAAQRVQYFKINWEKTNIQNYTIDVNTEDGGEFQTVYTQSTQIDNTEQIISLDSPVWAKQIRLNITAYSESVANWWNVSVAEFGAYAVEPQAIRENSTAQEIADVLSQPTVNQEDMTLQISEAVPEGTVVEFLADYEQIVGRDGTIHQPLTDSTVKLIYKVTKDGESAEGTTEHTVEIPGLHEDAGANARPAVIPELAEWYGGTAEGSYSIADDAAVYVPEAFQAAASAFVEDYNGEMGTGLTITSDSSNADIVFAEEADSGLGEEGYIMEITDSGLTVKAEHNTGAYWATRSVLQIAEQSDGSIPMGTAKDYPKYEVRGFMLDVARKPVSMETLQDVAKEMAYYKMNEFHLHLNDNLIFYEDYASAEEARELAYTGFRLESDIVEGGNGGQNKADLTNKDLYYTKEEFRNFILDCRNMGVKITPEFDTPGHSGAFTKVRPDLMLQNIVSGQANRAGEQFDLSPEKYEESLAFVESIWDEYLQEDMFDQSMTVHIGTDEYYGEKNRFRMFSDDLIEYVQSKGYTVRLWGSLSSMPGDAEVRSEGVQMNVWNTGWANPTNMYNEGFELINTIDGNLYIVPAAGYYFDYLNTQNLYNNWTPNKFGDTVIPAGSEQMLGSTYAIWNDSVDTRANGISEVDIYDRFADAVPTMASKNWGDPEGTYAEMEAVADRLGDAANSNPYHKASADENGEYMSYEFTGQEDSSANGRDLKNVVNAEVKDGGLHLKGGESYVETPVDKLATGNTLEFDITLNTPPQTGDILFEADNEGSNGDYVHDIRIMDDGRLGFRRELYDYYFDYKLPVGETVHMAISTEGTATTLTVDGAVYEASGVYRNRQTDGEVRVENISRATLLLPLQRIGSTTNAIDAVFDNVTVKQGAAVDYNKTGWTEVEVDSETQYTATEGLFEYAFDGNSGTIWHSNWQGASDKVQAQNGTAGNMDSIGGVINLGQKYTINQFKFTPRTGTASGQVTKADLYVKANESDEWTQVAADQVFPANASTKTFNFGEQEVQYIRFVAKESNDGWVAVSEFDIANVPPRTYAVHVEAQEGGSASGSAADVQHADEVTVTAEAQTGYIFAGWYDAVTDTKVSDTVSYTFAVTENTALIAKFEKTAEPGPGTAHTVTIDGVVQEVSDGGLAAEPAAPAKAGHAFLGWFAEGSAAAFDFTQPITADVTLTAKFQPYSVTVAAGETGVTVSAMDQNGYITVTAQEREGYNFLGWDVNGTIVYEALSYSFIPTADTSVSPVYEAIAPATTYYQVTINGVTKDVAEGTILTRPADPVMAGYNFIGWYANGAVYNFDQPVTSNLTITARFEKIGTPAAGAAGSSAVSGNTGAAVQTGDESSPVIWVLALVAACAAAAGVVVIRKKNNKK